MTTITNTPNRAARRHGRRAVAATVLCASMAAGATAVSTNAQAARDSGAAANSVVAAPSPQGGLATAAVAPVTGVADDGTPFTGTFTLEKFKDQRGVLYAVGRLDGLLGAESVSKKVSLPVTGGSNVAPAAGFASAQGFVQQIPPTEGACSILALDLGVIDLNLLGLHVVLDEVHLLIEAVPGAGALLGNLLCGVVGILDGLGLGGLINNLLDAIADLLNGILGV
jgi:hypothetical protein